MQLTGSFGVMETMAQGSLSSVPWVPHLAPYTQHPPLQGGEVPPLRETEVMK